MAIADGSQDFYEGGPSTFGPDLGTRETFCFVIDRLGLFASAVALPGCDYVLCNATFLLSGRRGPSIGRSRALIMARRRVSRSVEDRIGVDLAATRCKKDGCGRQWKRDRDR